MPVEAFLGRCASRSAEGARGRQGQLCQAAHSGIWETGRNLAGIDPSDVDCRKSYCIPGALFLADRLLLFCVSLEIVFLFPSEQENAGMIRGFKQC
jgi:hypothetical protein